MSFGLEEIRFSLSPSQKKKQLKQEDICKSIPLVRGTGEMFSYSLLQGDGERRKKSVKLQGSTFQMKQVTLFHTVRVYVTRFLCCDVQMDSKWV